MFVNVPADSACMLHACVSVCKCMHQHIISSGENRKKVKRWQECSAMEGRGGANLWHWQRLSPSNPLLPFLEGTGREKGCQLLWEAVPGQTGNQQAAFWDDAGKVQTQCGGQDLVSPPLLPLQSSSLTFPVSPTSSQYGLFHPVGGSTSFFVHPHLSCFFFLQQFPLSLTRENAISLTVFMAIFVPVCLKCIHSSAI